MTCDEHVKREVDDALRRSEQRFRLLAQSVPSILWSAAADGTIEYVNPAWGNYTGRRQPASIKEWVEVLHPEDRAQLAKAWTDADRSAADFEANVRCRRWDGTYRWFATRAVAARDKKGCITSWCGVATDVDDERRMADSLQAANRRKDEFIATLAHELRNPLAPIQHSVELLKLDGRSGFPWNQALEIIDRQVTHLVRLVNDLLHVSRLNRGKIGLHIERSSLASVVDEAIEAARPHIDQARHALSVCLPPEDVVVLADRVRLTQMLGSLLDNAVRFTGDGGNISIEAHQVGRDLTLTVADDGIGIDADALPKLFEVFAQADPPPGHSHGGLGVGLALVKGLAELHGGSIEARSPGRGQGSEFILRLPIIALPASRS